MELVEVCALFNAKGDFVKVEPYGNGHINTTYLASYNDSGVIRNYILQKINTNIFPDTRELMENIVKVTEFAKAKVIERGGNPDREVLTLVPTKDGAKYLHVDGEYYRMYIFIENTVALQIVEDVAPYMGAGHAFGGFISMLNDFPAWELYEVIKDFHNTKSRFINFLLAIDVNCQDRRNECAVEIDFFKRHMDLCGIIVDGIAEGKFPLRVTHNDTKLNNVLLDAETLTPVCVIDLDTIMSGSLLYDFGDCIRSGCNNGLEDEKDLSKVGFNINYFEGFVKGFLSGIGNSITENELKYLPYGAVIMTYECGMRFLTDYLNGDTYFKVHYPEHNIVRARTQIKMVEDMLEQLEQMHEIVDKYKIVKE